MTCAAVSNAMRTAIPNAERIAMPFLSRGPQLRSVRLQSLLECSGMLCLVLLSMAYLISGSYNPFLYFRF